MMIVRKPRFPLSWLVRTWLVAWLSTCLVLGGCKTDTEQKLRIALVPKGTTHSFWQAIHAGALKAAAERGGVEILWKGPAQEDKFQEQHDIVERFSSERVDAIILAPCNRQSMVAPVEGALQKGIPLVLIDSGLEMTAAIKSSAKYLGYIATDNKEGGREAGRHMLKLLAGKPKARVLMLPYQANSESTEQREAGFAEVLFKEAQIEFLVNAEEAGATVGSAQAAADRMLRNHKDLDGIFACNESSTQGVLQALRSMSPAPKLQFLGFDGSDVLIEAMKKGEIQGLVLQDPFEMGYQSTLRVIDALHGKAPAQLDLSTRLRVATPANLDDPVVRAMYAPDLSFLKK
jgi:ribose transport system substrate-binding protein